MIINDIGEAWRRVFFRGERGCYDTFDLTDGIISLAKMPVLHDPYFHWTRAVYSDRDYTVEMQYYWDGDGTLVFIFPDFVLLNIDCKCDYTWERLSPEMWFHWEGYYDYTD